MRSGVSGTQTSTIQSPSIRKERIQSLEHHNCNFLSVDSDLALEIWFGEKMYLSQPQSVSSYQACFVLISWKTLVRAKQLYLSIWQEQRLSFTQRCLDFCIFLLGKKALFPSVCFTSLSPSPKLIPLLLMCPRIMTCKSQIQKPVSYVF